MNLIGLLADADTGNNVALDADMHRRVCHIRLESPEEKPEEKNGFDWDVPK